jgi:crotonobetainyl-CoA:carnitine CoA-transferase CaiB-like acyl-CoA transferase
MAGFLGHVRALDLSRGVAGAYCAKLLADAGAEVIRVESAADPDPLRPPPENGAIEGIEAVEFAAQFAHLNSSKLSIDLDVTTAEGREHLLRLATTVDAVIEDRPPGALDALGIGAATLRSANLALVVTSITAFGQDGPYRDYRANELLVYAMGARMSGTGIQPRPPVRLAPESSSYFAGAAAAGATLTAIWDAATTGAGDHLDLSMVEALLGAPDRMMLMWEFTKRDERRIVAARPLQNFPCSEGYFALGLSRGMERPALAMGLTELVKHPRFADRPQPPEVAAEAEALITGWMVQRTRREAFEHLQKHRVIGGPINGVADLFDDPQFTHRGAFVDVETGKHRFRLPGAPFRELGAPAATLGSPPELGAHTEQVLSALDTALDAPLGGAPTPAVVAGGSGEGGADRELPLAGLRVIDFGEAYAGPYCCTLLADAGAEVIRVENIHRQPANLRGQPVLAPPYLSYKDRDPGERPWNRCFLHNGVERNKQGITLDISQPRGRELFLELVAESDVVVSNFALAAVERLGVTYDDLVAVNPKLVMAVISGYGANGPYRDYAALGSTIDAVAAHQAQRGYPETAPLDSQHTYFSDAITSYTAFFAVMAALHRRRESGEGGCIDVALTESLFSVIAPQIGAYSVAGELPPMLGNRDRVASPQGCYRTRSLPEESQSERVTDDRWIAITCRDEAEWQALLAAIGSEQLSGDARFADLDGRHEHHDALDALLNEWTAQYDANELMHRLQAAGVPAVALMPDSELMDDPHLIARGYFAHVDHRDAGEYRAPGPIWRSQRHELRLRAPSHCLGEHNREVLQGLLGVSDDEFEQLEAQGIIGEAYSARATAVSR